MSIVYSLITHDPQKLAAPLSHICPHSLTSADSWTAEALKSLLAVKNLHLSGMCHISSDFQGANGHCVVILGESWGENAKGEGRGNAGKRAGKIWREKEQIMQREKSHFYTDD